MDYPLNRTLPQIMHIDLNSAFAMIEQQANPFLRGKPVAVTNRLTRGATIIAASYEAKQYGIGVGTKMSEAKQLAPDVIVMETDPPKYIYAFRQVRDILESYSPNAHMKSIDEGVIDFSELRLMHPHPLVEIGQDIKKRLHQALGEWVTCNIGIGPNRFLAKLAAGLHKPDGLDVISADNLLQTYDRLDLLDLHGINYRYRYRLNLAGIQTPLEFLSADAVYLAKRVFHSINGYYWYWRLRGWETDATKFATRTIGKQYVLHEWTNDQAKLEPILMKMCEMMARRLRTKDLCARGLYISCWFLDAPGWHATHKFKSRLFTTVDIYQKALQLFNTRPLQATVKLLTINLYDLESAEEHQLPLFETPDRQQWRLTRAIDELNDRFGEFSVMPGTMANTNHLVPDKIPFGSVRHFRD